MLLEWVLTRDIEVVLSMAGEYGGWLVDDVGATRIRPRTWDDVTRAHTVDDSLPQEERTRQAVQRASQFVIPAREDIFDALRKGAIESWARPNGSGDLVRIEPIQWSGLRFRAVNGHDIAVPVDSEGEPLSSLRPLDEYLAATLAVPWSVTPTVWPDPVFSAEQAMRLWPKDGASFDRHFDDGGGICSGPGPALTGYPGRPSKGKQLIEGEFKRRCNVSEAKTRLDDEATALHAWYVATYPKAEPPTIKTIKNNIRTEHRQWAASRPQDGAA